MWARALAITLVSTALGNLGKFDVNDKWGDVFANLLFIYVGRSGLAFKTPPMKMLKRILRAYNKDVLCPVDINPHSFAEWVNGTDGKVHGKKNRKEIKAHPINIAVADEASKILGDIKHDPNKRGIPEFISQMWDNEIEPKYTRSFQIEGNLAVYYSMIAASSRTFYKKLEREFFEQGLGNRILWIVEESFTPPKLDRNSFFYQSSRDPEFEKLIDEIVGMMRTISEAYGIWMTKEAGKIWVDFANEQFEKIAKMTEDLEGEYSAKIILNVLKLSMCYSASRLNIDPVNMIEINVEDINRAIEDGKEFTRMWKLSMVQWEKYGKDDDEQELKSGKYDVKKLVRIAIDNGGTICVSEVYKMGYPDRVVISQKLSHATAMNYLKHVYRPGKTGFLNELSKEELEHYDKLCRGNIPIIYKVTKKGLEECGATEV